MPTTGLWSHWVSSRLTPWKVVATEGNCPRNLQWLQLSFITRAKVWASTVFPFYCREFRDSGAVGDCSLTLSRFQASQQSTKCIHLNEYAWIFKVLHLQWCRTAVTLWQKSPNKFFFKTTSLMFWSSAGSSSEHLQWPLLINMTLCTNLDCLCNRHLQTGNASAFPMLGTQNMAWLLLFL